ncbi:MAG: hypothetical protein V9F05_05495 [Chitinophagaceae bacterium]
MTIILIVCSLLFTINKPNQHYFIDFDMNTCKVLDTEANNKTIMNIINDYKSEDTICIAVSFEDWSNFQQRVSYSMAVALQVKLENQLNTHVRLCSKDEIEDLEYPGTFFYAKKLLESRRKILIFK